MRILILSLFVLISCFELKAQSEETRLVVDEPAYFPGGIKKWSKFLKKNLKYPKESRKAEIEGDVWLSFIVNKDGSVSDVKVTSDSDELLSQEAKRVLEKSPNWTPGIYKGEIVKSIMEIKISFRLR